MFRQLVIAILSCFTYEIENSHSLNFFQMEQELEQIYTTLRYSLGIGHYCK